MENVCEKIFFGEDMVRLTRANETRCVYVAMAISSATEQPTVRVIRTSTTVNFNQNNKLPVTTIIERRQSLQSLCDRTGPPSAVKYLQIHQRQKLLYLENIRYYILTHTWL